MANGGNRQRRGRGRWLNDQHRRAAAARNAKLEQVASRSASRTVAASKRRVVIHPGPGHRRAPRRCRLHSPQSLQTPPRHQSPNGRKAHPSRPRRNLIQVAANCCDVGNVALSGHPSRTAPSRNRPRHGLRPILTMGGTEVGLIVALPWSEAHPARESCRTGTHRLTCIAGWPLGTRRDSEPLDAMHVDPVPVLRPSRRRSRLCHHHLDQPRVVPGAHFGC